MFRPRCTPLWLPILAIALTFTGCKVMYRDVYSPKKNYYKPPKEKSMASLLPEEKPGQVPAGGTVPAPGGVVPEAAPAMPAAPGIPGLDAVPAPPPPAAPAMPAP